MHRFIFAVMLLGFSAFAGSGMVSGQEPAKGKIRVLLTYGGHDFQAKEFFAMFDSLPGVVYTKAEMPKDADKLNPGLKKDYDVIVMYDMIGADHNKNTGLTVAQRKAFVKLLDSGIGLISLHHNIGANQAWAETPKIIGGIHIPKVFTIDGKQYGPSGSGGDFETHHVTVVDRQHPITRGIKDFTIQDETYCKYYVAPDVKVLLTTDHPQNVPAIAWTKQYSNSRVFYLMLGHGPTAWNNPNYPKILDNAIHWAAGKQP
jgi:uncharacterized protein